jgi:hypothetical protein
MGPSGRTATSEAPSGTCRSRVQMWWARQGPAPEFRSDLAGTAIVCGPFMGLPYRKFLYAKKSACGPAWTFSICSSPLCRPDPVGRLGGCIRFTRASNKSIATAFQTIPWLSVGASPRSGERTYFLSMENINPNPCCNARPHLSCFRFVRLASLEPLAAFNRTVIGTIVVGRISRGSKVVCLECATDEGRLCVSRIGMVGTVARANPNNGRPALLTVTCFLLVCFYETSCASGSGAKHGRTRGPPTSIRIIEVYHLTAFH